MDNFRAMGPPTESEYGDQCPPQDAPEAISKAVASLPPEQMFELMKQMKVLNLLNLTWIVHVLVVQVCDKVLVFFES